MYMIKSNEGHFFGRHGLASKKHATTYRTPRELPLVIDWGVLKAKLTRYDENSKTVGYYKCGYQIVASVVKV